MVGRVVLGDVDAKLHLASSLLLQLAYVSLEVDSHGWVGEDRRQLQVLPQRVPLVSILKLPDDSCISLLPLNSRDFSVDFGHFRGLGKLNLR